MIYQWLNKVAGHLSIYSKFDGSKATMPADFPSLATRSGSTTLFHHSTTLSQPGHTFGRKKLCQQPSHPPLLSSSWVLAILKKNWRQCGLANKCFKTAKNKDILSVSVWQILPQSLTQSCYISIKVKKCWRSQDGDWNIADVEWWSLFRLMISEEDTMSDDNGLLGRWK